MRLKKMEKYTFKVYAFHPPEYKTKFYEALEREKKKGNINYIINLEETAPPPELIKDIATITATYLPIALKILYDFYKETKKKKGKVIIQINGEDIDIAAYNIDELEAKIIKSKKPEKE
jgi:hypothetical protein